MAALIGGGTRSCLGKVRQSGEVTFIEDHRKGFFIRQDVLAELGPKARQTLVYCRETILCWLVERCAGANEPRVITLQYAGLFGIERERAASGIKVGNPRV